MLVFAHCDDIAIGIGGFTKLLDLSGGSLTSVILTSQGARQKEEVTASKILGIEKTVFLDFEDGNFNTCDIPTAASQIREQVDLDSFDNIVSFDVSGYTGHPDHITASMVSSKLFRSMKNPGFLTLRSMSRIEKSLWEPYFIPIPDQESIAAENVDIRSVLKYKRASVIAHASQFDIDGRNHLRRMVLMPAEERLRVIGK